MFITFSNLCRQTILKLSGNNNMRCTSPSGHVNIFKKKIYTIWLIAFLVSFYTITAIFFNLIRIVIEASIFTFLLNECVFGSFCNSANCLSEIFWKFKNTSTTENSDVLYGTEFDKKYSRNLMYIRIIYFIEIVKFAQAENL